MLTAQVKEWGNSYAIRISKKEAKTMNIEKGDVVTIEVKEKKKHTLNELLGKYPGLKSFKRDRDDRF